jgi:hypothetical protein
VRAEDIPAWLAAGRRKNEAMRTVRFNLADRLVLVPVELFNLRWPLLALAALAALFAGLHLHSFSLHGAPLALGYSLVLVGPALAGAVLVPCLLPWLPTRAFSLKGAAVGLSLVALLAGLALGNPGRPFLGFLTDPYSLLGAALSASASAAYVALNFTGATVFTSQSGTLFETRRALPFITGGFLAGLTLLLLSALRALP